MAEEIKKEAPVIASPQPPQQPPVQAPQQQATSETEGGGINGPFPAELNKWNWGAFFSILDLGYRE